MNKLQNLMKCFKEIWDEKEDDNELGKLLIEKASDKFLDKGEIIKKEEYTIFINDDNIMGVVPKKKELKTIMENYFNMNNKRSNVSDFDFSSHNKNTEIMSKYSVKYFTIIFNLIEGYEEVTMKMNKNSPIWVETDDFICVLAPRIPEEDR